MIQELISLLFIEELEETERREAYRPHPLTKYLKDHRNPFELPVESFIKLYGLDQNCTLYLINAIKPKMNTGHTARALPLELKVLIALNFYTQGAQQKDVGQDMFKPMSQSTVSRCISEVSSSIVTSLASHWIKFPKTTEEITNMQTGFSNKFGFPGVIGVVDAFHVGIKAPADLETRPAYYNKLGFYSINCQVVCGPNLEITAINARLPGSAHDSTIWTTSEVQRHLQTANMQGAWLLGDSGYPLEPWLMTPYEWPTVDAHRKYNQSHILTRNIVGHCIGALKSRFQCMLRPKELAYKHQAATTIIYACAILHNICLKSNVKTYVVGYLNDGTEHSVHEQPPLQSNESLSAGHYVREDLIHRCFNVTSTPAMPHY